MSSENRNADDIRRKRSAKAAKKKARKKRNRIILFTVEILVLVALGVVLWGVSKGTQVDKINIEIEQNPELESYYEQVNASSNEEGTGKGYMQVALFGVDSREGELNRNTRTDTIIIASINLDTHEVKLVSVYRDTYLNLGNDSYNKCNGAYAAGGPAQAIQMLNMNLDLNIQHYVTVGFRGVVETVNGLGGVEIDITSAEIGYLNDYQYCIAEDLGLSNYNEVTNTGVQMLDGLQACAYCRIRYTAGDDFRRAERQRTVLTQMSEQAKLCSASTLVTIATNAFENVSTSFDLDTILELAAEAPNYTIVGSEGFPFTEYRSTGTIGSKGSCVLPMDLATNVSMLHEFLFGVEDYQPSSTVMECSERIAADIAPYIGQ
ncbi:MAG: LytR family transcriptional regulator [Lachnospiraceae bacterium]|nr:LytR family transcriptional regulator [Lachnospiraceae bacterium]